MKRKLLLLLFLFTSLLIFNSCNKDDGNPITPPSQTVPTLSSPSNGASDVAFPVTLIWNAYSGAASYTLQVSVDSAFTSFVFNQSGLTSTTKQMSGLSNSTTYYWRVSSDNSTGPSSTWSFKTALTGGTVPDQPVLLSPSDDSKNQAVSLTLSWNPSSGSFSYNLQVSTSNSFTTIFFNQSNIPGTSTQISGLSNGTVYYWRVSGNNNNGSSNWSSVWSFTTVGLPPAVPTLISPGEGETDVLLTVTFRWNASAGAQDYTLQVSTSSSFTNILYNQSGITVTNRQVSGLSAITTYYWRVIASNTFGSSNPSNTWNFKTVNIACPGLPTVTYYGKTYNTVQVGTQCWFVENLDVGTQITGSANPSDNGTIEKYCYGDDAANCNTYGGLYQWNEAMAYSTTQGTQGICPPGWHIPTLAEFEVLKLAVNNDGNALKSIGQGTGGGAGTNTFGFSALLSGYRNSDGNFGYLGYFAYFWSSTGYVYGVADLLRLNYDGSTIYLLYGDKRVGISVRCVKD